jgi:hypothetical protein
MAKLEISITPAAHEYIQQRGSAILLAESRNSTMG